MTANQFYLGCTNNLLTTFHYASLIQHKVIFSSAASRLEEISSVTYNMIPPLLLSWSN